MPWALGAVLCVVGLAATHSPIGIALAFGASLALAIARKGPAPKAALVLLTVVMALVVAVRSEVRELEPVRLRLDNWRSAVWVKSTAPAADVGLDGFGQVAQQVPLDVGKRARHAHSLPLEWLAELGPLGVTVKWIDDGERLQLFAGCDGVVGHRPRPRCVSGRPPRAVASPRANRRQLSVDSARPRRRPPAGPAAR